jgi:hypothetical protein
LLFELKTIDPLSTVTLSTWGWGVFDRSSAFTSGAGAAAAAGGSTGPAALPAAGVAAELPGRGAAAAGSTAISKVPWSTIVPPAVGAPGALAGGPPACPGGEPDPDEFGVVAALD